jgi:hypothetical protein
MPERFLGYELQALPFKGKEKSHDLDDQFILLDVLRIPHASWILPFVFLFACSCVQAATFDRAALAAARNSRSRIQGSVRV